MEYSKKDEIYLSKSLFIRGLQCHKSLYLHKYRPELKDEITEFQEATFQSGTEVGILARDLFPGGVLVPYEDLDYDEQLNMTKEEMGKGTTTLYEAAFSYNNIFIKTDILHKVDTGWELYEVKNSTKVKDQYIPDLALQYYVLKGVGVHVTKACIVHINNQYVKQGDLELNKLFTVADITSTIEEQQNLISGELDEMRQMLKADLPVIDISNHCFDPYDCDFYGHCWQHIPEDSIFSIGSVWIDKFAYYKRGMLRFNELPQNELNELQKMYTEAFLEKKEYFRPDRIKDFLTSLWYPLCFLDFETIFRVAVPMFDGTRPYQQIPFQYSLDCLDTEKSELKHFEYLGRQGVDPRRELIEKLIKDIPENACALAYNKTFETGILNSLKNWFPEYTDKIDRIINNMRDPMIPFQNKDYYHWELWGSYSLKYVLPTLIPELSYEDVEISDGATASDKYLQMFYLSDTMEIEKIRKDLLDYCKLDTLGMVKIVEKLKEMVK
jgi:hypothetical protein